VQEHTILTEATLGEGGGMYNSVSPLFRWRLFVLILRCSVFPEAHSGDMAQALLQASAHRGTPHKMAPRSEDGLPCALFVSLGRQLREMVWRGVAFELPGAGAQRRTAQRLVRVGRRCMLLRRVAGRVGA